MKVWFVTIGEPTPIDGNNPRLLRNGILAKYLLERGHEILWWNSTFNHTQKNHRFTEDKTVSIANGYQIRFLHSTGYSKNISISRLIDHFFLSLKFSRQATKYSKPDIILCSMPPISIPYQAVAFAKKHSIPVVIDLRDKWPEIFTEALPMKLRFLAIPFIYPLKKMLSWACKNATALMGMTDDFVQWGCKYADRQPEARDRSFPFGYKATPPIREEQDYAFDYWAKQGIVKNESIFTVCFFGAMANQVVFEPVCRAFEALNASNVKSRLIFCGDGPLLKEFQTRAAKIPNITFPGWVNKNQICALMQMSDAGLVPLRDNSNFRPNISNKPIEYMSAGLPILCSVHGVLKELLLENNMGMAYSNESPEELVDAIKIMASNHELRAQMRRNTLAVFNVNYREETVYKELVEHLEFLANYQK